jgi:hypothetical protein
VATEVVVGSPEQSDVRQSVAGIVVGEKNRCIQISAPALRASLSAATLQSWQGQFQGQSRGQSAVA